MDRRRGAGDGPCADADGSDDAAVERAFDARAPVIETLRALLNTTGRQPAMGGGASHVGLSAGPGRSVTAAAFRRALDVNTLGSFILSQAAAERLIGADADEEGERGGINKTSSLGALEGTLGRSEERRVVKEDVR